MLQVEPARTGGAQRWSGYLGESATALDLSDNEIHPHLAMAEAYLGLGRLDEALASAEPAHRNLPQQSMGTGLLAAVLIHPPSFRVSIGRKSLKAGAVTPVRTKRFPSDAILAGHRQRLGEGERPSRDLLSVATGLGWT